MITCFTMVINHDFRILCSFEGKCLVEETTKQSVLEETDEDTQQEGPECLSFSCSLPESRGRGFIEVQLVT